MKKEFIIESKRTVEYMQINDNISDVVFYKEEIISNNQVIKSNQGITDLSEIENLTEHGHIKNKVVDKHMWILVLKNKFRELVRTKPIYLINYDELPIIDNCYDFMNSTKYKDDYEVVQYGGNWNHRVKDLDNNYLPQALHFDYMHGNGEVNNSRFDLQELLDLLKNRNDIKANNNGANGKLSIIDIPWYNADEVNNEQLDFVWIPSDEDFAKINNEHINKEEIIKTVFGYTKEIKKEEY